MMKYFFAKEGVHVPENKKKKKVKWILIPLIIIALASALGVFAYNFYNDSIYKPTANLSDAAMVDVIIEKGASSSEIAEQLYKEGLIKNTDTFKLYLKLSNLGSRIQAGRYELTAGMSAAEIVDKMVRGDVKKDTVRVTIPEGLSIKDIADKFDKAGLVNKDKFLEVAKNSSFDYDFLKNLPKRPERLEGYLFPDTYEFNKDVTAEKVIDTMLSTFNRVFDQDMRNKAKGMNMSIDQVVTMASIVEKEARVAEERPIISAVYYNRIKKKMLLQADATVQYALGQWKDKLTYDDLKIDSPYNTYKYPGLPIGPIANPGKASIEAALNPQNVDYLYYVAKGDGTGTHAFTVTYDDFLKEKQKASARN